jgi:hypothetical protein
MLTVSRQSLWSQVLVSLVLPGIFRQLKAEPALHVPLQASIGQNSGRSFEIPGQSVDIIVASCWHPVKSEWDGDPRRLGRVRVI